MPLRYPVDELVALQRRTDTDDEDEQAEAFDLYSEAFGWVDHRATEREVVEALAWQLEDGDELTCREDEGEGYGATPIRNGVEYPVPLTRTGSDRYVMLHSLAEILKDRYVVFCERDSMASDTHGFLVLTHEDAAALRQRHGKWMDRHLESPEPGVDGFSGLKVPWLGHEAAAPGFARKRAKMDARAEKARAHLLEDRLDPPLPAHLQGDPVGALTHVMQGMGQALRQQHLVMLYVVLALGWAAFGGFTTLGQRWRLAGVVLLSGAAFYHHWVAQRMRRGWRPLFAVRSLPGVVLLALLLALMR